MLALAVADSVHSIVQALLVESAEHPVRCLSRTFLHIRNQDVKEEHRIIHLIWDGRGTRRGGSRVDGATDSRGISVRIRNSSIHRIRVGV